MSTRMLLLVQTDPEGTQPPRLFSMAVNRRLNRGETLMLDDPIGWITARHVLPGAADMGMIHVPAEEIHNLKALGWRQVRGA
jgi:hypothetical protein